MRADMEGQVAIVTAAASGIGRATLEALLGAGASVVAVDLDTSSLGGVDGVLAVRADATDPAVGPEVAATAMDRFGRIDALVNVVGGLEMRPEGFLSVSDEGWLETLNFNFFGMVRMTRAVLPHLVEAGRGSIVSIASEQGRQPDPMMVDYAVAKSAVINLSKSLSIEFGPKGIRSNVISPGPTRTPALVGGLGAMAEQMGISTEEAIRGFVVDNRRMPAGRLGEPSEVANVVVFLASDLSSQVTGSDYRVDGGIAVVA